MSGMEIESEVVDLSVLRRSLARARELRPRLSAVCDLVAREIGAQERRGMSRAALSDLAIDVGLLALDEVADACGEDTPGATEGTRVACGETAELW